MSCRGNLSRGNFIEHELTDDEESDSEGYIDDMRSMRGRRGGSVRSVSHRNKVSSRPSSADFEEDSEIMSRNNRPSMRTSPKRRSSVTRPSAAVIHQPIQSPSQPANRTKEILLQDRYERLAKKNVSDSPMTPDSESESAGRKALVQAKIREKLAAQQSSMDESSSDFWRAPQSNENTIARGKAMPMPEIVRAKDVEKLKDEPNVVEPENETSEEIIEVAIVDDGPMGPPPSTPDHEWECQFCTFVNEPKTKICIICCKTPIVPLTNIGNNLVSQATIVVSETASQPNESTPPTTKITHEESAKPKSVSPLSKDSGREDSSSNDKTKGRNRKISFWPGTKPK